MALPKKKRSKINSALDIVDELAQPTPINKFSSGAKKVGRPRTVDEDRERITLFLTPETLFRVEQILIHRKHKNRKSGEKVDRSLIIEEAVKEWLEKDEQSTIAV